MSFHIYSHEALPNPDMLGKPGYTPDECYVKFGGVTLPALPKQKWLELDEENPRYVTFYRWNWTQKAANLDERQIPLKKFIPIVKNKFSDRGVIMLDHKPTPEEAKHIEQACAEENLRFRKRAVEFFEQQREIAIANKGTYPPNVYIDECYEILNMNKPYSLEALMRQRDPGAEATNRLMTAMAEGQKESAKAIAEAVAEVLTRPAQPKTEQPKEGFFKR